MASRGVVATVVARRLQVRVVTFEFLTFEETPRFMAAVPPKWKTFAMVPLRTGLRVGELLQTPGDE